MPSPTVPTYTVGIDTGGTFTDVVVLTSEGEVFTNKAPTTPWDFSQGVMDAVAEVARSLDLSPRELLSRTSLFKHGSTVATNALITRSGARVGLLTTRGFEDTPLIMRAVGRVDGLPPEVVRHVPAVTKPEPLVPKSRIRGIHERVDYQGNILVPLNEKEAQKALRELVEGEGVEALAVSFLHSWANPTHERQVRQLVEGLYNGRVFCSLGSDLARVAGEYARTNTAIINSYVGPIVDRYLEDLETKLQEGGFQGSLLIMQGNGGVAHRHQTTPVANLQSGPTGGMMAAAYMARLLGHDLVVTTDMGGTSFDVGLLTEGLWRYAEEPIMERFRILQPIIDIESIGAGGGTLARVDPETGRLMVGPQSAGAHPGPVCYDEGGEEVTVTDADLVLGFLSPESFLGGRKPLNAEKAHHALEEKVARPLNLEVVEAAAGIYNVINAKMSDLIRRKVVRTGYLPEEAVIYAFGGAGPTHAAGYAAELGVRAIYVFPTSPVFSAFGIASADVIHTRVLTCQYRMPAEPQTLNRILEELEGELASLMAREGFSPAEVRFQRFLTLRYRRQTTGVELLLPWSRFGGEEVEALERLFEERYEALYGAGAGYTRAGVEISAARVDAIGPVPKPSLKTYPLKGPDPSPALKGYRRVFFPRPVPGFRDTPIYAYEALEPGNVVLGPAVIEASFTTVPVPPGSQARVDEYLNLVLTLS